MFAWFAILFVGDAPNGIVMISKIIFFANWVQLSWSQLEVVIDLYPYFSIVFLEYLEKWSLKSAFMVTF